MNRFLFFPNSVLCSSKIQFFLLSFIRILEAASGLCSCLHASHPHYVDRIHKTEVAQSRVCVLGKLQTTTFLPTLMVSFAAASTCLHRFGKRGSDCQVTHGRAHAFCEPSGIVPPDINVPQFLGHLRDVPCLTVGFIGQFCTSVSADVRGSYKLFMILSNFSFITK